ncbi:MAG: peptidylprolyl isomerase [Planctomycetota bacterium]
MAKHKAATEISFAQEERSAFAVFVDRYKWHGLLLLGLISAVIIWRQSSSNAAVESLRSDWSQLYRAQTADAKASDLAAAAKQIERPSIAAWARVNQAAVLVDDREYSDAEQVLAQTMQSGPAILTSVQFPIGPDGSEQTLVDHLVQRVGKEKAWAEQNPYVIDNPPLADDAPRVELVTDRGSIILGLDVERAPLHAKNFLARVEEDYYDGTRFHRVIPGRIIQGGDPNSREDDPSQWGLGGPEQKVPSEESGLIHTEGVLAAAKTSGATESSGSQFYLTVSRQHQFDGNYVVYGRVLEGLEIIEEIAEGELREDKPETPVELVTIREAKTL